MKSLTKIGLLCLSITIPVVIEAIEFSDYKKSV